MKLQLKKRHLVGAFMCVLLVGYLYVDAETEPPVTETRTAPERESATRPQIPTPKQALDEAAGLALVEVVSTDEKDARPSDGPLYIAVKLKVLQSSGLVSSSLTIVKAPGGMRPPVAGGSADRLASGAHALDASPGCR